MKVPKAGIHFYNRENKYEIVWRSVFIIHYRASPPFLTCTYVFFFVIANMSHFIAICFLFFFCSLCLIRNFYVEIYHFLSLSTVWFFIIIIQCFIFVAITRVRQLNIITSLLRFNLIVSSIKYSKIFLFIIIFFTIVNECIEKYTFSFTNSLTQLRILTEVSKLWQH